MAGRTILIPPPCEPVTLAEAKAQLRVSNSVEDARIRGAVKAARLHCEGILRRQMVLQTVREAFDGTPEYPGYPWGAPRVIPNPKIDDLAIVLSDSPLQTVLSIAYTDSAGAAQTLDSALYFSDTVSEPPRIMPTFNTSWPSVQAVINAVRVSYASGLLIPFTADTNDLITLAAVAAAPVNGTAVFVKPGDAGSTAGALPTGLASDTMYYVINASGQTCKLSATPGGTAIDITGAGTGIHLMDVSGKTASYIQALLILTTYFFENRGDGAVAVPIPDAVDALLGLDRNWRF